MVRLSIICCCGRTLFQRKSFSTNGIRTLATFQKSKSFARNEKSGFSSSAATGSEAQLQTVSDAVTKNLSNFFNSNDGPVLRLLHKDISFKNGALNWNTKGIGQHLAQISLMRLLANLRYAKAQTKVIDTRQDVEEKTISIWFRFLAVGHVRSFGLTPVKTPATGGKPAMGMEKLFKYKECESKLWLDSEGKVIEHRLKVQPKMQQYLSDVSDEQKKIWPFDQN